jgi:hypothetical protein
MIMGEWPRAVTGTPSAFLAAYSSATAWNHQSLKKDWRSMLRRYKGEGVAVGDRVALHDIF